MDCWGYWRGSVECRMRFFMCLQQENCRNECKCHLKLVEALKIVSLRVTCSSAWIVTLALKTCTSHTRLSLLKESLGNKTAFGSPKSCTASKKKENREGHAWCKAALLAAVNPVSVHSAWRTALFWVVLGSRWSSHCGNEKSFCLFALL